MTFVSHAQNFEDVLLWRALRDVEGGRYLDIGAQDPIADSVSLGFYELGWRGTHVEATPHYAARLRAARPDELVIQAAVTDNPGPIQFYELIETGLSTGRPDIAQEHERAGYAQRKLIVPCARLDHILEMASGDIHWMKIDVEGMEGEVLRSWGDSSVRPWVLVIEATYPNSQKPTHAEWLELVLKRGYREVFYDGLSRYFVHHSQTKREAAFDAPANVFDGFAISRLHFCARSLRAEIEEAEQHVIAETSRATSLAEQLADLQSQLSDAQLLVADARERETSAVDRLVRAEREHSAAIDEMSRQREAAAKELRAEYAQKEADLTTALEELRAAETATRIDFARLEERAAHIQTALTGAQEERDRIRAEAEQERAEHGRLLAERDVALENNRARLRHAVDLVQAARAQQRSAWVRLGKMLRLWRMPATYKALFEWSETAQSGLSDLTQTSQARVQQMVSPAFLDNRDPYLRANSLHQLVAWDDIDFVRCAYVTVLGRRPDDSGERYYVDRLRGGEAKLQILYQLRNSHEGRLQDPGIAGFDRALRRFRRARLPMIGPILAREYRRDWVSGSQYMRRIENALWRNHNHETQLLNSIVHLVEHGQSLALTQARREGPARLVVQEKPAPADDKQAGLGNDDLLSFFSQSAIRNIRRKLSA